ncbi:YoaK family protein [Capnocytophaga catalasegens]|uniref:DUF1275 domain-containing protein n=1 Tax=Capnocytophaga catalasegens TaxID=1004260 RepID=A0AAV5AY74_9FLAO|nr:YoaK family protein [Capnocytophaga catalasegens]GIZ16145.1 hypothetical protein RCZ03_21450 [Capnocytophaga catalasegens]GJM50911.1 hypothetical protein RCZ15_18840 [Capnocytophaga catalasegens]GJM53755.1 hypothetical protein RCZ16_20710 [Capnocytophaga catalasegens]
MFHHQGKNRTPKENLQIAVVLSFVAGMVNVAGFLSFGELTTNVTGHFAHFIRDFSEYQFWKGVVYFVYIVSFLIGSFVSGWLIESAYHHRRYSIYLRPTLLECSLLVLVVLLSYSNWFISKDIMACILLFAMGVQNSFVTRISHSVVRTTHLTGLITDLGIEVSQMLYLRRNNYAANEKKIKSNIRLRLFIILFFFFGGITSGYLYFIKNLKINVLLIAVAILLVGLFYDNFRLTYLKSKRRYKHKWKHTIQKQRRKAKTRIYRTFSHKGKRTYINME